MLAILIALLPAVVHFTSQESKPNDPAALVERAKIAEELGDAPKAERLLRLAMAGSDRGAAAAARARLANLERVLGRGEIRILRAVHPRPDGRSPMDRRFADALAHYLEGTLDADQFNEVLALVGESALSQIRARIDDPATKLGSDRCALRNAGEARRAGARPEPEPILALQAYARSDDPLIRRKAIKAITSIPDLRSAGRARSPPTLSRATRPTRASRRSNGSETGPRIIAPHLSRLRARSGPIGPA